MTMRTGVGVAALLAAVGAALPGAEPVVPGPGPVLTQILGTALDYRKPPLTAAEIEQSLSDLASQGFSLSWDACPAPWTPGLLENQGQLEYCREMAARVVRHGMGNVFVFPWNRLLPRDAAAMDPAWLGETLNPETGTFALDPEYPSWNFGSAAAKAAFAVRSRALFQAVGPYHMFLSDEQILASPGGNDPHVNRMSTYWTSPTYSKAALGSPTAPGSFRHYLAAAGSAQAETARFPVTTVVVPPGPNANMGLPAVPLNDGNADRLQADNEWPDSALWQHWYGWRTEIYKEWIDVLTSAAHETWGGQPGWLGCAVAAPYYWYDKALGLDVNKIASVPRVDYVVAGYFSGMNFQAVRDAAQRHGKRWGGMVELSHYGTQDGVAPQAIIDTFKANVDAGADIMLVYAGANFRSDRLTPNDKGAYYMPAQVAAWAECIRWLEQGRGLRRVVPRP